VQSPPHSAKHSEIPFADAFSVPPPQKKKRISALAEFDAIETIGRPFHVSADAAGRSGEGVCDFGDDRAGAKHRWIQLMSILTRLVATAPSLATLATLVCTSVTGLHHM
jgi:hypothetical protein